MSLSRAATWFAVGSRAVDLRDADFVFGATHLLREFLDLAADMPFNKRVILVVPFLERALVERESLFRPESVRRTDILLITTSAHAKGAAAHAIAELPWRSCEVRALHGLHSKVYVAIPDEGAPVALLGSHNLTAGGSDWNHELGVLVYGRSAVGQSVVAGLQEHIADLRSRSRIVHDSQSPLFHAA